MTIWQYHFNVYHKLHACIPQWSAANSFCYLFLLDLFLLALFLLALFLLALFLLALSLLALFLLFFC